MPPKAKTTTRPIETTSSARPWVAAQNALRWRCPFCSEWNLRTATSAQDVDPAPCKTCGAMPDHGYTTASRKD